MKGKEITKKGIAWLLTAAMLIGVAPVMAEPIQVQAEKVQVTTKTIAGLGTSGIADPTVPDDESKAWTGSYVYYGYYNGSPVKYRVLDASTTEFGGTTMLLDCDSALEARIFDERLQVWANSEIKKYLNSESDYKRNGFLTKSFSPLEQSAIAASTKAEVNSSDGDGWNLLSYTPLNGEKIFLLDAKEVTRGTYGYSNTCMGAENRKKIYLSDNKTHMWWLRSIFYDPDNDKTTDYVGFIHNDGEINNDLVSHEYFQYVSPAFNLNLSSVIFSSVVKGNAGKAGAVYKLTLLDSDMTIVANGSVTRNGNTVTVPYSITGNHSADATQVSLLITDKEYTAGNTNEAQVLAYEKLTDVNANSTSGTGTFTLPDSLAEKTQGEDYHIYLLAEHVNVDDDTTAVDGSLETDYASEPAEVKLVKAGIAPNAPKTAIDVAYTTTTVGAVTLPEGWVWQDADKTKALEAGKAVTATAIYNGTDKGNYETESVEISITRQACTHTWDAGVVTKEATATEKGVKTYTCSVCKETKAEEIPVIAAKPEDTTQSGDNTKPEDTTESTGYDATEKTEKTITTANTDKGDVKGSTFAALQLKAVGNNKSVKLTWKKVKDADGYILYAAECGKKLKKQKTFTDASKVEYTHKKLKNAKYYKYMVVAYKNINGKKCTIATSKSAHVVTNGGKYANPTKVTVKASKLSIKKGAKKTIKASYKLAMNKKLKVHIAKFRYESDNPQVATVTSKGVVKGKKKGTANIYVYAQNGVYKKVKVTVK